MDGDGGWRIVVVAMMVAVTAVPMLIGMVIERERERELLVCSKQIWNLKNDAPLATCICAHMLPSCCGCNAQICRFSHVVNFRHWRKLHWKNIHVDLPVDLLAT